MKLDISLVVLFCVGISGVCPLSVSGTGKNETKHILEGDNLLLSCNTTELKHIQEFYWIKNGTYGQSSELYSYDWKIEFFGISRQASGIYICHGLDNSTNENITLTTVTVDVQYPAECDSMSLSPRVITENQTFELNCSFHGNPGPVWSVFNNDTGVAVMSASGLGANESLYNISVRCGDSGMWVCSGYNELSHRVNATRGYHLTVLCPPRPEPLAPSSYIYYYKTTVGVPVTMSLNITADPEPTYSWSRDDGSGIETPNKVTKTPKGTSLMLLDVGVRDFGKYKLRMLNSYGSFVAHFVLQAYGFPGAPYDVLVGNITDTSANVAWFSGYDMGSQQSFYIVRWINANTWIKISDDVYGPYKDGGLGHPWNYHLTGLAHATHYVISVVAENAGNMTYSQRIDFNTNHRGSGHYDASDQIYYVVGGTVVGMLVLIMVVVAALAYFIKQRRSTSPMNEKKKILQNIQPENGYYGDAPSDSNMKTPIPSHKQQKLTGYSYLNSPPL